MLELNLVRLGSLHMVLCSQGPISLALYLLNMTWTVGGLGGWLGRGRVKLRVGVRVMVRT